VGRLAAKHLLRSGADVVLISRDIEKATQLAEELGENVRVDSLEKLEKYINRYRLLFTATASAEPIITMDMVEEKELDRVWFDMAIPRDIEDIEGCDIRLFRIDDLQNISRNNHALRQEQALRASEIVKRYKEEFFLWLQALSVEPVIKRMRLDIAQTVDHEVERAVRKGFIPEEYAQNLRYMVMQTFDRYLHEPTRNMREASKRSDGGAAIEAVRKIFAIDLDDVDPQIYKTSSMKDKKR